ncbi:RHS repeat domain-containing protein, partial [Pseudomonas indica]|uniref:RHS repeat domain-containing protein n=1 Tax=Pseudomonas indica TaxID=137658 RepID=UPI000BD5ABBC
TTYYHNDHLGNPVAATDERGDLLWRAHFTPYGERHENPATNAFGTVGYTGHAQDKASGLVYMGARYYDPVIGRFMAVDPVGFQDQNPQSFGRYLYANNNPLRFLDPDGRMSDEALLSGNWVPGFEGNIYNGSGGGGLGPVGGVRRGVTQQGELVNSPVVKGEKAQHANKIDDRPATLYEKYDKDGNFLKHGITKHENPAKRYTAKQIDGGTVVRTDRGPRSEMIKKERDLVERSPGPDNREPWAGKRLGE